MIIDGDDLPIRQQLRQATPRHHQYQCRDDGLQAESRHQHAIPGAAQQGSAQGGRQGPAHGDVAHVGRHAVVHHHGAADQHGGHRAGQGHDGAHGNIDAARGDHQGHAQGRQHQGRRAVDDIDHAAIQVAVAHFQVEKAGDGKEGHQQQQQQRGQGPAQGVVQNGMQSGRTRSGSRTRQGRVRWRG
ncbi:hypothetical protein D3C81_1366110 [compost metagenome]